MQCPTKAVIPTSLMKKALKHIYYLQIFHLSNEQKKNRKSGNPDDHHPWYGNDK